MRGPKWLISSDLRNFFFNQSLNIVWDGNWSFFWIKCHIDPSGDPQWAPEVKLKKTVICRKKSLKIYISLSIMYFNTIVLVYYPLLYIVLIFICIFNISVFLRAPEDNLIWSKFFLKISSFSSGNIFFLQEMAQILLHAWFTLSMGY